jgi:hypothetical protein
MVGEAIFSPSDKSLGFYCQMSLRDKSFIHLTNHINHKTLH